MTSATAEARRTYGWGTTTFLLLVSFISYLDRNTLAVLAPTILRETHLTAEQYGFVISAFSLAYMAGNPFWGYVLDRVGLTRGLTTAVALWSTASAAHALTGGFASLAAARGLLGWAEGATFPAGLRGTVETLPPDKRGRGMAVAYSGGSLGAIVTPLVVTPIALWFGWRAAFWFTGAAGALWLAAWLVYRRHIVPPPLPAAVKVPMPKLNERRFWALVSAYALGAAPLACGIYAAPIYLSRELGLSQAAIGKLLFIPPLGWELGYFFWAWVADRFAAGVVRPVRFFATMTVLSLPVAAITASPSVAWAMTLFFVSMFVAAGFVIFALRFGTLVYPPRHVGLVAGISAGSWSALVALVMPLVGAWFDARAYTTAFALMAALPVAGFLGWAFCSRGVTHNAEQ